MKAWNVLDAIAGVLVAVGALALFGLALWLTPGWLLLVILFAAAICYLAARADGLGPTDDQEPTP